MKKAAWLAGVGLLLIASRPLYAESDLLSLRESTGRLIVKLRDAKPGQDGALAQRMSVAASMPLSYRRPLSGGAHLLNLPEQMTLSDANVIAARLSSDPAVAYAEPDRRRYAKLTPNDPSFSRQWNLFEAAGGINAPAAWDVTTGAANIVVAVLDTGILPHQDIAGPRVLPGYDFISADMPGVFLTANDGDGRDADPGDPGDSITQQESDSGFFKGCTVDNSSWHGTFNAGLIAAATDNGIGIAGINWTSRILPLRVLGKCGGYTSDILDAMRWAAGLPVPNVPNNTTPAQVINASLGGAGPCSMAEQSATNDVLAAGVKAIVVPAGNESQNAANSSPAICNGVITVAATTRSGSRAPYSNFGAVVTIAAPGGTFPPANGADAILSTLNTGQTTPAADAYGFLQGTSFSTSHVSGVISLMLSVNPALTAAEVRSILQSTARAFPDSSCTTTTCGAGIIDAAAAVRMAQQGLSANPFNVGFVDTPVNQQSAQTVTFTNSGVVDLSVGSAAVTGPQAGDFRLTSDTCSNQTLTVQASCALGIAFVPAAAGARVAVLVLPSNAVTSPSRVGLSGSGVAPPPDSGGGGGCAIAADASFDPALLFILLAAFKRLAARVGRGGRRRRGGAGPVAHLV